MIWLAEGAVPVFVSSGVISPVIRALQTHCSDMVDISAYASGGVALFSKSGEPRDICRTQKVMSSVIVGLQKHFASADMAKNAGRAIASLAKGDPDQKKAAIADYSAVPVIVSAIKEHSNNPDVLEPLLAGVLNLASESSARTALMAHAFVNVLKCIIEQQQRNVAVVRAGIRLVQALAADSVACAPLMASGVVEIIIESIRNSEDPEIQCAGCVAIANLSLDPDAKDTIGRANGIPVVVSALRTHAQDKRVVTASCAAISNMCIGHTIHKSMLARENGLSLLASALSKFKDDKDIASNALSAMMAASANTPSSQQQLAGAATEGIILGTIHEHMEHPEVLRHATALLWGLSYQEVTAARLAQSAEKLVALLSSEITDVQLNVCGAILVVAGTNGCAHAGALIDARVHESVCTMLEKNLPNLSLQRLGFGVLENIMYPESRSSLSVDSLKAFTKCAIAALNEHLQTGDVVEVACKTLQNLAMCGSEVRQYMVDMDILSAVTKVLAKHDRDAAIQEVCLNCLSALIDGDKRRDETLQAHPELVMLTRKTMDRFKGTANVQVSGCVLLRTFVDGSNVGQELLVEANGFETLLKSIENHFSNHDVTSASFACLAEVAAGSSDYAETIARSGGMRHATRALSMFSTEEDLLTHIFVLLSLLPVTIDKTSPVDFQAVVTQTLKAMHDFPANVPLKERAVRTLWNFSMQSEDSRNIMRSCGGLERLVAILNGAESDRLQQNACCAIWSMSAGGSPNGKELLKHNIIKILISTIQATQDKPEVVKHACAALANMVTVEGAHDFIDAMIVGMITDTICAHQGHPGVQQYIMSVCCDLAIVGNKDVMDGLLTSEFITTVVSGIKSHPGVVEIHQYGFAALAEFASYTNRDSELQARMMASGAAAVVMESMLALEDEGVSGSAWHLMFELIRNSEVADEALASPAHVQQLARGMKQHAESPHVQQYGFGYLWAAVRMMPSLAAQLIHEELLQHAVSIAPKHLADTHICEHILAFFGSIAATESEIRALVVKLDVIPTILKIMRAHPSHQGVQLMGCFALRECCSDYAEYNQNAVVFSESLPYVIQAAKHHKASISIQIEVLNLFKNVAFNNGKNQSLLAELDVLEHVTEIMDLHAHSGDIQKAAGVFMAGISARSQGMQNLMREKGCIAAALRALQEFSSDTTVVAYVLRAVACVAVSEDNHALLGEVVLQSVKECLDHHNESEEVQASACMVVQNLARSGQRFRKEAASLGVAAAIVDCMKQRTACPDVLEPAFGALMNITIDESTRADLCTHDIVAALHNVAADYASNVVIVANIMGIFRNLADAEELQAIVWADGRTSKWIIDSLGNPNIVDSHHCLQHASAIVRNLSRKSGYRSELLEVGATQRLISVVRTACISQHASTEALTAIAEALGALFHLSGALLSSTSTKQSLDVLTNILKTEKVAELTSAVLRTQIEHEAIVLSGCALLRCVAIIEGENRDLCHQVTTQMYNIIDTFVPMNTDTSVTIIGHAAGVIWTCLAMGQDMQQAAGSTGAAAILKAVKTTQGDPIAHEWALAALRQFIVSDNDVVLQNNACTMTEDGAVQLCAEAIKLYPHNSSVVNRSSGALQAMAASENRDFVSARGGLGKLVDMLETHADQVDTCEVILAAIGNLGVGHQDLVAPLSPQVVPLVTKALFAHSQSAEVQVVGLTLLRNIAVEDSAAASIEKTRDTLSAIVKALAFPKDESVHEAAAATLWSLASCRDQSKVAVFKSDAVPALCNALEGSKTMEFQICAFGALSQIVAYHNVACQILCSEDRILGLALTGLQVYNKSSSLHTQIFNLLRNMCNSGDAQLTNAILERGILDEVQKSMRTFSSGQGLYDPWVQISGHQLLWTVCKNNMSAITHAVKRGAVEFALEKAKDHHSLGKLEAARVQEAVFGCVRSFIEKERSALGDGADLETNSTNILNTVVLCTSSKPDALPLLCSGYGLLGTLGRHHDNTIQAFKQDGENGHRIAKAMREHKTSPEMQMHISTFYMLMVRGDQTFANRITADLDGVNALLEALKTYPDDAAVQGMAFEALWQLALCTSTRDAMVVGNLIPMICKAMKKHKQDRDVQEFAARLLWALMVNELNNQKAINAEGAQRLVIGAMKNIQKDQALHTACSLCVSLLASPAFPDYVSNIVKEGVVPLLTAAMRLDMSNQDLQASACAAILSISGAADTAKQVLINEGCFGLLTKATGEHVNCPTLLESSTTAMCNLASLGGKMLADEFSKAGGPGIVHKVSDAHADNATLQRNCGILTSVFG